MTQPNTQAPRSAQMELPSTATVPLTRIADGTLRVTGTRIPIDNIVHAYRHGHTAEQFCEDFPTVSVADFNAVIGYYVQNREVVDAYLRLREQEAKALRRTIEREIPWDDLRERLAERQEALKATPEA